MTDTIQNILVYITVLIAAGFIIKKFFLPKKLFASNKNKNSKACGQDGCGCH